MSQQYTVLSIQEMPQAPPKVVGVYAGNLVQGNHSNEPEKGRRVLGGQRTGIHTDQPVLIHYLA